MKKKYIRPVLRTLAVSAESIICASMPIKGSEESYVESESDVLSGKTEWQDFPWNEADE